MSSKTLTVVQPVKKLSHCVESDFHQRIQTSSPQLAGHCVCLHIIFPCIRVSQLEAARIFNLIHATCPTHVALLDFITFTTSDSAVLRSLSPTLSILLSAVYIHGP